VDNIAYIEGSRLIIAGGWTMESKHKHSEIKDIEEQVSNLLDIILIIEDDESTIMRLLTLYLRGIHDEIFMSIGAVEVELRETKAKLDQAARVIDHANEVVLHENQLGES
jgi:hypothetical protein